MNEDVTRPAWQAIIERLRTAFRGIRSRLLVLTLSTTIVAITVITVVAIISANNLNARAQQASSQSLRAQAEAYLIQVNQTIAEQNDLILDRAARDVQTVAEAAAAIYADNPPSDFWPPQEHMFTGSNGQYMNGEDDVSSVFVPAFKEIDENVLRDIELGAYLDLTMAPVFNNNPNAAAIYLGTENEVTRYYPNIKLGELVPPDFQVTQRPW